MKSILHSCLCCLFFSLELGGQTMLSPLFTDHVVLQRNETIRVWGYGTVGENINLQLADQQTQATPDLQGKWMATFAPRSAGGPYDLIVQANDTSITCSDIYIGDVWLCSGQSNMEWTVAASKDAKDEINAAKDQKIRHFKVPHSIAYQPDPTLEGGPWEVGDPDHVGDFTAVGYFFAREVRKHHDVAIGLLNSSWGGTRIEPWIDAEGLDYDPDNFALELKEEIAEKAEMRKAALEELLGEIPREDVGSKGDAWAKVDFDDSDWTEAILPGLWEQNGYRDLDGVVWYRRVINLEAGDIIGEAQLTLGKIDDSDITYVNGSPVGRMTGSYNIDRVYALPADRLVAGKNIITVRVEDTGGGGGFHGDPMQMKLKIGAKSIALDGKWLMKVGRVDHLAQPPGAHQTPTVLNNKMIHPILPFPVRGVLWYQGESNASPHEAYQYRDHFKSLITSWRRQWHSEALPFFHVQLANFMQPDQQPAQSGWALLRESQTAALKLKNTAEAVIIDIGEADDIHPRNKQDVGYRLSLAARNMVYNEKELVFRSPTYESMEANDKGVLIKMALHNSQGIEVHDKYGYLRGFAIAGRDKVWTWAQAELREDGEIWVYSNEVSDPQAVRYAWGNNPDDANLYNLEGLPVTPFRTDNW